MWGGRWNPPDLAAIYVSSNPSLAALEVLVHYEVLPLDFVLTPINIPDHLTIETVSDDRLPDDWNREIPDVTAGLLESQLFGSEWLQQKRSVALSVPSNVMGVGCPSERNFVLNPEHSEFAQVQFLLSSPFRFDTRLK